MAEEMDDRVLQAVHVATQIDHALGRPSMVITFHPLTGPGLSGSDVAVGSSRVSPVMLEAAIRTIAHVTLAYLKAEPVCDCDDCKKTIDRLEMIKAITESVDPTLTGGHKQ